MASFAPTDTTDYLHTSLTQTFTIQQATVAFSNLKPPLQITQGTSTVALSGHLGVSGSSTAPPLGETVTITIRDSSDHVLATKTVQLNSSGNFSANVSTSSLQRGTYTIKYSYTGDGNFSGVDSAATNALTVQ
jgi:hypothetical protein